MSPSLALLLALVTSGHEKPRVWTQENWWDDDGWHVACTVEEPTRIDGWRVRMRFDLSSRKKVRLAKIEFVPDDDAKETTGLDLSKSIRHGEMYRAALEDLRHQRGLLLLPEEWVEGMVAAPRPGRAGNPPAFYALWAKRYEEACEIEPRSPVKYLAEKHIESRLTLDAILHQARHGKPGEFGPLLEGRRCTKEAIELLKNIKREEN
jgi:hypothetical protein